MSEVSYSHLKPYYQEEFEKISSSNDNYKGKWNWFAFLFSCLWAFSKGLWVLGVSVLGISIALNVINPKLGAFSILLAIFCGLRGNYLYYNSVKNKK